MFTYFQNYVLIYSTQKEANFFKKKIVLNEHVLKRQGGVSSFGILEQLIFHF